MTTSARISRQLSLRTSGTLRVLLAGVEGLGPDAREQVVAVYGDVLTLSRGRVDELSQIDGIDHALAQRVMGAAQRAASS